MVLLFVSGNRRGRLQHLIITGLLHHREIDLQRNYSSVVEVVSPGSSLLLSPLLSVIGHLSVGSQRVDKHGKNTPTSPIFITKFLRQSSPVRYLTQRLDSYVPEVKCHLAMFVVLCYACMIRNGCCILSFDSLIYVKVSLNLK